MSLLGSHDQFLIQGKMRCECTLHSLKLHTNDTFGWKRSTPLVCDAESIAILDAPPVTLKYLQGLELAIAVSCIALHFYLHLHSGQRAQIMIVDSENHDPGCVCF